MRGRTRWLPILLLMPLPIVAHAQAGPPMITNDPGTPGPGAWEINVAAAGVRANGAWGVDAPDIDINRGVGEHVQLSLHTSWAHGSDDADNWASGAGPVELGVRWRFLDQSQAGVAVAVQPLWTTSFSPIAQRKGLAPINNEFVLPVQVAHTFEHAAIGGELARHFVANEPDTWQAGIYGEYDCGPTVQCLAEINTTWEGGARPILNLGARKAVGEHLNLLGSLGRQLGGPEADLAQVVFYLGAQFVY
jgi:hypothetical protein